MMKSTVIKRSIVVAGHKTSVSLEDAFWSGLKEIAEARDMTLSDLVAAIDAERVDGNLSSAIRLFVLRCCRREERAAMSPLDTMPAAATVEAVQVPRALR
jgi:predicted DNA-binding ribbon-helix-helix protein